MVDWEALINDYSGIFLALTLFSLVSLLLVLPIGIHLLTRLPSDYFINLKNRRNHDYLNRFPHFIRLILPIASNLVGILLIIMGFVMLILPGQGLLTILAGLILTDFPGKFAFERWLFRRHHVYQAVDWLRKQRGQPPFLMDYQGTGNRQETKYDD